MDVKEPTGGLNFEQVWVLFQETDRQFKEMIKESDRKFQEMIAETNRQIKETNRAIGKLSNRFGELVEHLVSPRMKEK
ncbi:MAG: hypothetical protein LBC51_11610, partial [Treponema sp.]|nr:hypothetical protein [Treponema sp.]